MFECNGDQREMMVAPFSLALSDPFKGDRVMLGSIAAHNQG